MFAVASQPELAIGETNDSGREGQRVGDCSRLIGQVPDLLAVENRRYVGFLQRRFDNALHCDAVSVGCAQNRVDPVVRRSVGVDIRGEFLESGCGYGEAMLPGGDVGEPRDTCFAGLGSQVPPGRVVEGYSCAGHSFASRRVNRHNNGCCLRLSECCGGSNQQPQPNRTPYHSFSI